MYYMVVHVISIVVLTHNRCTVIHVKDTPIVTWGRAFVVLTLIFIFDIIHVASIHMYIMFMLLLIFHGLLVHDSPIQYYAKLYTEM